MKTAAMAKRDTARKVLLRKVQDTDLPEPELVAILPPPDYSYVIGKEPPTVNVRGDDHDIRPLIGSLRSCHCALLLVNVPCKSCEEWIGLDAPRRQASQRNGLLAVGLLIVMLAGILAVSAEDSPGRRNNQTVELD